MSFNLNLDVWFPIIRQLGPSTYWDIDSSGAFSVQASDQAAVKAAMVPFGGVFWDKRNERSIGWWEYTTKYNGLPVKIYACRENPPTCKVVGTEEYQVEERVPVQYETRTVTKTRPIYDCHNTNA